MPVLHFAPCINSFIKVKLFRLRTFYMNLPIVWQSTRSGPKHCRFWAAWGRHSAAPCGQHGAAADVADTVLSHRADTQPIQRRRHAADTALPRTADARQIQRCRQQPTRGQHSTADARPIQRSCEQPTSGRHSTCKSQRGAEPIQRGAPPR